MYWRSFDWKGHKVGQKGEVLSKAIYKCGFCRGIGSISYKRNARCPVCLGKGAVRVPSLAVVCAYCDGGGRARLNRDLICIICKGKGVVGINTEDIEICPSCKGRGREKGAELPCLSCKGKGVVGKLQRTTTA